MMVIVLILLTIILIVLLVVFGILYSKKIKRDKEDLIKSRLELLATKGIQFKKAIYVNEKLILTLNKTSSVLTCVENIDDENRFKCSEILTKLITKIEKAGKTIKVYYTKQGDRLVLDISPFSKETEEFIYKIFKHACIEKIKDKYRENNFTFASGSDWGCGFLWAYDPKTTDFVYYKTDKKPTIYRINLKREVFTLNTKHSYFEAPISGQRQQLFVYEQNFLDLLYNSFMQYLKATTAEVSDDLIFYNNYGNFVYISNGINSIQSIDLDNTDDVEYEADRILFTRFNDERPVKVFADVKLKKEIEEFITGYNLNKISQGFDYNFDKLINATPHTKFIIDFTKKRCIYCARLDSLSKFTYITIAFSNLAYVSVERTAQLPFVRINTFDNDTIDVSCSKLEVADYITAQLRLILMK